MNIYYIAASGTLTLIYLIFYWIAGMIDPGIMKRNLDCYGASQLPMKMVHKGVYKTTKVCITCNIVRPFRSTHCKDCDNCTLRFDHHCPWLGNCVAKRNYIFFYFYLMFLNFNNIFILSICSIGLYNRITLSDLQNRNYLVFLKCLPSIFTTLYLLIIMFFTTGLFFHHTLFICSNKTTKEEIKKLVHSKIGNPYDKGICSNCANFCTRKNHPPLNVLKQLRKKGKFPINSGPKMLKPKSRRITKKLLQESLTMRNTLGNLIDRDRFFSINPKDINNTNNPSIPEEPRQRLYSMAVGNKKLYHAMKNLTLTNIEINDLETINENNENNENNISDYNSTLLNDKNEDISTA